MKNNKKGNMGKVLLGVTAVSGAVFFASVGIIWIIVASKTVKLVKKLNEAMVLGSQAENNIIEIPEEHRL